MANKDKLPRTGKQRGGDDRGAAPTADRQPEVNSHITPPRAQRRPEMIRQRQVERRQAYERERRQWLLTRMGLGFLGTLLAVGIGYLIFTSIQRGQVPEGTSEFEVTAGHTAEAVAYDPTPPVGGEHDAVPQTCGFYSTPIRNENAVHSLEHGAVWITYRPDLPSDQVDRLRALAEDQGKVLVSPVEELPAPVVASSWGRQLPLESTEDDRLGQFVQRFRGAAPEPAAPCVGVGTPL